MNSHTPGPWRFDRSWVVADFPPEGRPVDGKEPEFYSGGYVIAETVTKENGPLIAAAPELLEALRRLYEWERSFWDVQPRAEKMGLPEIEFPESSGYMDGWLEKNIDGPIKAAIAKALGLQVPK